jgi:hypothetical protein
LSASTDVQPFAPVSRSMARTSRSSASNPSHDDDVPLQPMTWHRAWDSSVAACITPGVSNWASAPSLSAIRVTANRPKCALTPAKPRSMSQVTGSSTVLDEGVSMPSRTRSIGKHSLSYVPVQARNRPLVGVEAHVVHPFVARAIDRGLGGAEHRKFKRSIGESSALFKPTGPGVNPTAPLDPRSRGPRPSIHGQTRRLEAQPDTARAARTVARPGSHGS